MKKKLIVFSFVLCAALSARSTEAAGGIGLAAGNPAGITLRFDRLVITAGYAYYDNGLMGAVDYWILNPKLPGTAENLNWYLGAGGFAGFTFGSLLGFGYNSGFLLGARVPIGLQWFPSFANSIELYIEAAPGIRILPSIAFDWQASVGIRFLIFK